MICSPWNSCRPPHLFLFLFILTSSYCTQYVSWAKQGDGFDLPHNDPLRVGIKKRGSDCSVKTKARDKLSVHYVGSLYKDNKVFDSSRERQQPFKFAVGTGSVISGWDKGLIGMCKGEIRKLTIPSDHGYGEAGAGSDIHAGATLVFEIELLDILAPDDESAPGPWTDDDEIPDF